VFILEGLKVLCFDTLLQVLILKVDSGLAGDLAEFFALSILLPTIFLGNAGGKGLSGLARYFMGYYTIWLAPVKRFFVPFWESALLGLIGYTGYSHSERESTGVRVPEVDRFVLWRDLARVPPLRRPRAETVRERKAACSGRDDGAEKCYSQVKLAASLGLPVPLYLAFCG